MNESMLERLPHRPPMRLVTRCIDVTKRTVQCEADLFGNPLFAGVGTVPSLFCVELVAQTGAVLLAALDADGKQKGGRLVSSRKFTFHTGSMDISRPLEITVELLNSPDDMLLLFQGTVRAGGIIAEGQVAVYRADE